MKVKDVMSASPEFISPDTSLRTAAELMSQHEHGFLPIGENDRLIGIVTDRDIVIRGIAHGMDPNTTSVREVMSDKVLYCFQDDALATAADSMEEQQVHRLVVLNDEKRLSGVISVGDITHKSNNQKLCAELIKGVLAEKNG